MMVKDFFIPMIKCINLAKLKYREDHERLKFIERLLENGQDLDALIFMHAFGFISTLEVDGEKLGREPGIEFVEPIAMDWEDMKKLIWGESK